MPTACILQDRAHIHLKSERLEILQTDPETGRDQIQRSIPIHDLERLILSESVQISSAALAELLRREIPVSLLGWNDKFLGSFFPSTNQHGLVRLRQYQRNLDSAFALQMAKAIIQAKINNQRRVLQRLSASRGPREADKPYDATAEDAIRYLDRVQPTLLSASTLDEARGYEGASTARYFRAWSGFLPQGAVFERRSTRPPLNAVNACISFGSTLLYQEMAAFVHAHGLDPALGWLHTTENGRWSLALDLMEPFRPALVEALSLDLFSHRMVIPEEHFSQVQGGVYLNREGRRKFLLQYERRMERQFLSEFVGHRTTLRQQVEHQVTIAKRALDDPSEFKPWLMN